MAIEHILVDGYSILHQWEEFRKIRLKNLAASRQALIHLLTQFHDCRGGRLTIVFDGRSFSKAKETFSTDIQVIYSKEGQTADSVIERIVGQSPHPNIFLIATDDHAEQNIVEAFGAQTISCDGFHAMVKTELEDLDQILTQVCRNNRRFNRNH